MGWGRQLTCRVTMIRITEDFSSETMQARKKWNKIFEVLKGKNLNSYSAKFSRLSHINTHTNLLIVSID